MSSKRTNFSGQRWRNRLRLKHSNGPINHEIDPNCRTHPGLFWSRVWREGGNSVALSPSADSACTTIRAVAVHEVPIASHVAMPQLRIDHTHLTLTFHFHVLCAAHKCLSCACELENFLPRCLLRYEPPTRPSSLISPPIGHHIPFPSS